MKTLLDKALLVCDAAEVYQRDISSTQVTIRFGKMQGVKSEKKTEIAIRIVKDGNMGTAVGTSLEDETLLERALISLENQKSEATAFPNDDFEVVQSATDEVQHMTTEEFVKQALNLSDRIKSEAPDVSTAIIMNKTIKRVSLMNSSGFEGTYDYTNIATALYTLNQQGFYSNSLEYSGAGLPVISDDDIQSLIMFHRLSDHPVQLENEKMPVIFDGNVMGSLMLRVLGGVNAGNVIKEVSPLAGKIGESLFSNKITIRDDGTYPYGCNTYAFDDEGTPSQNTVLYENGVLKRYLASQSHAAKLGVKATGNAQKRTLFSKEIEDAPSIYDSNLVIEGDSIPDETLIKNVKRGLFITGVMGAHTGNINQGEFSMNISSGYLIENGEFVGKVKGAMIAGNIYDLFKNIEAIGTQKKVMRSIFYHMGYSPMVLFGDANIVGK